MKLGRIFAQCALLMVLFGFTQAHAMIVPDRVNKFNMTDDMEDVHLRGQVSIIEEYMTTLVNEEGVEHKGEEMLSYAASFSPEGDCVYENTYETGLTIFGSPYYYHVESAYTYESPGRLTRLLEKRNTSDGDSLAEYSYKLDLLGRITEKSEYDSTGQLVARSVYTYRAFGSFQKCETYTGGGEWRTTIEQDLDEFGRPTHTSSYGNGVNLFTGVLGPIGYWEDWEYYQSDTDMLPSFNRNKTDVDERKTYFSRDQYGNILKITNIKEGKPFRKLRFFYIYDSVGNWVERTESMLVEKFGSEYYEPQEVRRRVITYYSEDELEEYAL